MTKSKHQKYSRTHSSFWLLKIIETISKHNSCLMFETIIQFSPNNFKSMICFFGGKNTPGTPTAAMVPKMWPCYTRGSSRTRHLLWTSPGGASKLFPTHPTTYGRNQGEMITEPSPIKLILKSCFLGSLLLIWHIQCHRSTDYKQSTTRTKERRYDVSSCQADKMLSVPSFVDQPLFSVSVQAMSRSEGS